MFELYQSNQRTFKVDRTLVQAAFQRCEALALEAITVFAQKHLWEDRLPVAPIMVSPDNNGGWGHLLPMWFKPHERPVPFYALDNWALFAAVYRESFGNSAEAETLLAAAFSAENLVQVVTGSNLMLPFLPSTQGAGLFFRHGMLPFLLSILWLDEPDRQAWLDLHKLGAEKFAADRNLRAEPDPVETLNLIEFAVFARLERNGVETDEAVRELLETETNPDGAYSLLDAYRTLFGAINLGVASLAHAYEKQPLDAWRDWAYQEFAFPYRTADFGKKAMLDFLNR